MALLKPPPNNSVACEGYPSIRAFAKAHNLPEKVVSRRLADGETGDTLRRPVGVSKSQKHQWCGRTALKWSIYAACQGVELTARNVSGYLYDRERRYGDTPEEAVDAWKKHNNLK